MLIRQLQSVEIRPIPTAHLTTTMSLLVLNISELQEKIISEMASNPAIDIVEGHFCPNCQRPLLDSAHCPICSRPKDLDNSNPIVLYLPE